MLWNTPLVLLTLTHAGHENQGGSSVTSATRVVTSVPDITRITSVLYRQLGKIMSEAVVAHRAARLCFSFSPRDMHKCTGVDIEGSNMRGTARHPFSVHYSVSLIPDTTLSKYTASISMKMGWLLSAPEILGYYVATETMLGAFCSGSMKHLTSSDRHLNIPTYASQQWSYVCKLMKKGLR